METQPLLNARVGEIGKEQNAGAGCEHCLLFLGAVQMHLQENRVQLGVVDCLGVPCDMLLQDSGVLAQAPTKECIKAKIGRLSTGANLINQKRASKHRNTKWDVVNPAYLLIRPPPLISYF